MDIIQDPNLSRRSFLKAGAATAALIALGGCGDPRYPYDESGAEAAAAAPPGGIESITGAATATETADRLNPPAPHVLFSPWETGETIYEVPNPNNWFMIRCDDGPWRDSSLATDAIFNSFGLRGIPAQAWVADNVRSFPDEARQMQSYGYEIINHSKTHSHYDDKNNAAEMQPADDEFEAILGIRPETYAGPGLIGGPNITAEMIRLGKCATSTKVFIGDTDTPPRGRDEIVGRALGQTHSGSLLVCHMETASHGATRQAMPYILDGLLSRGMVAVTMSQLFGWRYNPDGTRKPEFPVIRTQRFENLPILQQTDMDFAAATAK